MQDMYANSNEGMVFKLVVSLEKGGKSEPLEGPPSFFLNIYSKMFKVNNKLFVKHDRS